MVRDFEVNLDTDDDRLLTLGRADGTSDHLVLHKGDGFRVTGVLRLHPPPFVIVNPADPTYPFVSNAVGPSKKDDDGRFRIKTPDLKQDDGIKFNHYMLDWAPQNPPAERPGPHYKVFP